DDEHDQQQPDGRGPDGDLGEGVAGPGAEGAGAASPAESACQATTLAPLNEHKQDQEEVGEDQEEVQERDEVVAEDRLREAGHWPGPLEEKSRPRRNRHYRGAGPPLKRGTAPSADLAWSPGHFPVRRADSMIMSSSGTLLCTPLPAVFTPVILST